MAVNIDTVYKTVLLILNKENRGYMTPDEFNRTATQVQLDIFNAYFEDLNQQLRIPDNNSEYSDRQKNLQEKIAIFEELGECDYIGPYFNLPNKSSFSISEVVIGVAGISQYQLNIITPEDLDAGSAKVYLNGAIIPENFWSIENGYLTISGFFINANDQILVTVSPFNFYKLGTVLYDNDKEVQYIQANELAKVMRSKLTYPTKLFPLYRYKDYKIFIYPESITNKLTASYIRKPIDPRWSFTTNSSNQYIYDYGSSTNFELHPSEQPSIITQILLYSGIIIKDPQIVQIAAQQAQAEKINEKS